MLVINFANLVFRGLNRNYLLNPSKNEGLRHIITVNSEFIVNSNNDPRFRELINSSFATFDGQIPYWLAKLKNSSVKFEKISGSDFIYDACAHAHDHSLRVFLLGGNKLSNAAAVTTLRGRYHIDVDGYSPPHRPYPFDDHHNRKILDHISAFEPHFLFVGFGAMKQEFWVDEHKAELESMGVRWAIGCGGTFDFVSGRIPRAPAFLQRLGLEGVYRLIREPRWFRVKRLLKNLLIFRYVFTSRGGVESVFLFRGRS
ncbi:glycosyltransferase [bacterium]|nr:glycosyltransferase [bacterium]